MSSFWVHPTGWSHDMVYQHIAAYPWALDWCKNLSAEVKKWSWKHLNFEKPPKYHKQYILMTNQYRSKLQKCHRNIFIFSIYVTYGAIFTSSESVTLLHDSMASNSSLNVSEACSECLMSSSVTFLDQKYSIGVNLSTACLRLWLKTAATAVATTEIAI